MMSWMSRLVAGLSLSSNRESVSSVRGCSAASDSAPPQDSSSSFSAKSSASSSRSAMKDENIFC